jgi:hypothetical protein
LRWAEIGTAACYSKYSGRSPVIGSKISHTYLRRIAAHVDAMPREREADVLEARPLQHFPADGTAGLLRIYRTLPRAKVIKIVLSQRNASRSRAHGYAMIAESEDARTA